MSTETSIKIPDHLSAKFLNIEPDQETVNEQGTVVGESGHLEDLISFGQWLSSTADSMAQQRGYPGLGDVPPDKAGELLGRMADKNLPDFIKSRVDEISGVSFLGGILYMNYMHHKKMQAIAAKDQGEKNED